MIGPPPDCRRCGRLCMVIYSGNDARRTEWRRFGESFAMIEDPRVKWLCADCVDEIAEESAP